MMPRVILIGLRGSGKSTLGPRLASWLATPFCELDAETCRGLGASSVREAWERAGEERFREAETAALRSALESASGVISLGGGTPTAPGAATLLLDARHADPNVGRRTIILYLRANASTLQERLRGAAPGERPTLTGRDPIAEVPIILSHRDGLYTSLADEVIETDGMDEQAVLDELVRRVIHVER